jgi:cbb3-type cytochrome oxidase subunit 3
MNTVLQQAAATANLGWVMGLNTIMFMGIFVAWSLYLWSPSRKQELDNAGNLPLEDK